MNVWILISKILNESSQDLEGGSSGGKQVDDLSQCTALGSSACRRVVLHGEIHDARISDILG